MAFQGRLCSGVQGPVSLPSGSSVSVLLGPRLLFCPPEAPPLTTSPQSLWDPDVEVRTCAHAALGPPRAEGRDNPPSNRDLGPRSPAVLPLLLTLAPLRSQGERTFYFRLYLYICFLSIYLYLYRYILYLHIDRYSFFHSPSYSFLGFIMGTEDRSSKLTVILADKVIALIL